MVNLSSKFLKQEVSSLEREHGLNYNLSETKEFFMKHYNNSDHYHEKLQELNLRNREKVNTTTAINETSQLSRVKGL